MRTQILIDEHKDVVMMQTALLELTFYILDKVV
jgi:hypothetical protein